jgi:twitching motility protein PilT
VPNSAIRNLIREDKVHQIYSAMQVGQAKYGMQTFNQSLATLALKKQITRELALAMSSVPEELREMLDRGVTGLQPTGTPAPARAGAARRETYR